MISIIEEILKDSFAPIIVQFFIENGLKMWTSYPLGTLIFFLAGFLCTKLGNLLLLLTGIFIWYKKR